jgi:hypothetical protein
MGMHINASASLQQQRSYERGPEGGNFGHESVHHSARQFHHGNYQQQAPPHLVAPYSSADSAVRQSPVPAVPHGSFVWLNGAFPQHQNAQGNVNERFHQSNVGNGNVNMATPPQSIESGQNSNMNYVSEQNLQLILMFKQMMTENEQKYILREEALKKELQEATKLIAELRDKIFCGGFDSYRSQQQGQRQRYEHQWPEPRRWQQWKKYPYPTAAPDTPNTNAYLKTAEELIEAEERGQSMAPEGMKCKFVEHFGKEEGNLLKAKEAVKYQAVSADLECRKGLAGQFAAVIGKPKERQLQQLGTILVQDAGDMGKVKSVITKRLYHHKFPKKPEPFITEMEMALHKVAEDIIENVAEHPKVAIPRICSGLDGLKWPWVQYKLQHWLKDTEVEIHVYNLKEIGPHPRREPLVVELETETSPEGGKKPAQLREMPAREGKGHNPRYEQNFQGPPLK